MKRFISLFVMGLILVFNSNAQEAWFQQHSNKLFDLNSVFFINENKGWAIGSSDTVLITNNSGQIWTSQYTKLHVYDLLSMFFISENVGWVCENNGRIIKTLDGGLTWALIKEPAYYGYLSIFFTDVNNGWVVGTEGKLLRTINGGSDWNEQNSGTSNVLASVFFKDKNNGWVAGQSGTILHTIDGGNQWSSQVSSSYQNLYSVYFKNNEGWAVGKQGTILHTNNSGTNWETQTSNVFEDLKSVFFIDNKIGWAVGNNGVILNTKNSGQNWTLQQSGTSKHLKSVYFISSEIGFIVGYDCTILKTTTGGDIPNNPPHIINLSDFRFKKNEIYITNLDTCVVDLNHIASDMVWQIIPSNPNLRVNLVNNVAIFTSSGWAGITDVLFRVIDPGSAQDSLIIKVTVEEPTGVSFSENSIPKTLQIYQNYPNPFNLITKISFELSISSSVSINAFNVNGIKMSNIFNGFKQAGYNSVIWDASSMSTGIYYIKISIENESKIIKCLLLK